MRQAGSKTRYPGVYQLGPDRYRVTLRVRDSRTGRRRLLEKVVTGTERDAVRARVEIGTVTAPAPVRRRVGDCARSWLELKAPSLDHSTGARYAEALERFCDRFGDWYADMVRREDVQGWVNAALAKYSTETVRGWYRVARTMVRDQDWPQDPTVRVAFRDEGEDEDGDNALTEDELAALLAEVKASHAPHYALLATLAFTGLRFCHASALRWEDIDEERAVIHIRRKQVRGRVGNVNRKKRAPKHYPLLPALAEILREHRRDLLTAQAKREERGRTEGFAEGWCFPSRRGTLRTPGGLWHALSEALKTIGVERRFTVHGLRRTFNDLVRRAGADAVVARSLTGHVTEKMREHYSSVRMDEQRAAVAGVLRLVGRKEHD